MKSTHRHIFMVATICAVTLAAFGYQNASSAVAQQAKMTGGQKSPLQTGSECIPLTGSTLCRLGGTFLALLTDQSVKVTTWGTQGADGVSSTFGPAHTWSRDSSIVFDNNVDDFLTYSAAVSGEVASTLQLKQNGTTLDIAPDFKAGQGDTASYAVQVTLKGKEVFAETSMMVKKLSVLDLNPLLRWYVENPWFHRIQFRSLDAPESNDGNGSPGHPHLQFQEGACRWALDMKSIQKVRLPSGTTVSGDTLVITEQVTPGSYAYHTFDRIDVTGHVYSLTATKETTTP